MAADRTDSYDKLPTQVVPRHYDLTIEPDFTKLTFDGNVIIDADVKEDTTSITLNTVELIVHSAELRVVEDGNGVASTQTTKIETSEADQITKFTVDKSLLKGGKIQLEISFTGTLNDKMAGFYRSTYKKEDGTEAIIATTQMQPADARKAFPCFDEPALKAEFTVTLIADQHLTCLSNMDVSSETTVQSKMSGSSKKAVRFNKTPLMSTYLVAFIVGELNYIESTDFRVPCRIYAPLNQDIEHGRFALNLTIKTLNLFEKTFGVKFPLPKMDQVAMPDAQGAMENWGLIIYRAIGLLIDEKTCVAFMKEQVAETVQHELSHQWFGNLVTMEWWEGLWLNEGFATWASWYSTNIFFPEWNIWQSYISNSLQEALGVDSLRSSHPIQAPLKSVTDLHQIFDNISYSKGSCVIRMLSAYLGEDVFLEGIRTYLAKHAYSNATTEDLWNVLAETSGKPVHKMMATWTEKVGFPVVTVTEKDGHPGVIHVRQNRFLRTGDVKSEEDQVLFPIFLNVRTSKGVDKSLILDEREKEFTLESGDFFKINADQTGLYRTLYTPDRLTKLGQAANGGLLTVEDRVGLIADAGSLAASGYQKTSGALELFKGFSSEMSFVVWKELIDRVDTIQAAWMGADKADRDGLEAFLRDLTSPVAHKLGWEFSDSDGHIERQFKGMMFKQAGMTGDKTIIEAAKDMFEKYMAGDTTAIAPDIRREVFAMTVKYGGTSAYEKVFQHYGKTLPDIETNDCLAALGNATQPDLIARSIELSHAVRAQDVYRPLLRLNGCSEGIKALYTHMTTNFDNIIERFPPSQPMFGNLVFVTNASLSTQAQLDDMEKFFEGKNTAGYNQALAQVKDVIRSKISWTERDGKDVTEWLRSNGY